MFVFAYLYVNLKRGYHQAQFEKMSLKEWPNVKVFVEYAKASVSPYNTRQSLETKFECDPIHVSLTVIRFKLDWIRIHR